MCDYQGHEYGATYPDSICIDGELWDADSCEDGYFTSGGDYVCPRCNTVAFLQRALEDAKDGGCGQSMWWPWCAMTQWEGAIAKARRENAEVAEAYLSTLKPFTTDDWRDRSYVYAGHASWENTIEREWRYTAQGMETRRAESGNTDSVAKP